jgi:hypothetical protein
MVVESRQTGRWTASVPNYKGPVLDQYWEDGPQFTGWGEVVAKYPDEAPAIVEGSVGQGWVILSGSSVTPPPPLSMPINWRVLLPSRGAPLASVAGNRGDQVCGERMSEKVVWQMLKTYIVGAGLPNLAPHDLRRTTAKLCRAAGGELEQIQLLLGHSSVQTTERYLGTKQDLAHAPNDGIKLKLAE